MILSLATDAAIAAEFDRLIRLAHAANHAKPRTAATVASAKRHISAMKAVSDERVKRANESAEIGNILLKINNDWADWIVGSGEKTFEEIGRVLEAAGSAAGGAVGSAVKASGMGFWFVVAAAGLVAVYIVKK